MRYQRHISLWWILCSLSDAPGVKLRVHSPGPGGCKHAWSLSTSRHAICPCPARLCRDDASVKWEDSGTSLTEAKSQHKAWISFPACSLLGLVAARTCLFLSPWPRWPRALRSLIIHSVSSVSSLIHRSCFPSTQLRHLSKVRWIRVSRT